MTNIKRASMDKKHLLSSRKQSLSLWAKRLLTGGFLGLPYIFGFGAYEPMKVRIFFVLGLVLILFWLGNIWKSRFDLRVPDWWYLGWVVLMGVVGVSHNGLAQTISGSDFRHQGILFFFLLWLFGRFVEIQHYKLKQKSISLFWILALLESLYVLMEYFFFPSWRLYAYQGPMGTFGEPNLTASFIVFTGSMSFLANQKWKYRFVLAPIYISAIFVLNSYSAWLIVGFFVFWHLANSTIFSVLPSATHLKRYVGIASFAVLVVIFFVTFLYPRKPADINSRYWIWNTAQETIARSPFVGFGPDTTESALMDTFELNKKYLYGLTIERAHNIILDIGIWSGVIGIIMFGFFVWKQHAQPVKNASHGYTIVRSFALLAWVTTAFFHPIDTTHWVFLFFLLYL